MLQQARSLKQERRAVRRVTNMDTKFYPKSEEQAKDLRERMDTATKAFSTGMKLLIETMEKDYQVRFMPSLDYQPTHIIPTFMPTNLKEYGNPVIDTK